MHSSHIVHNVGKAAEQCNDHAFGKLYISLTEADKLPVGGKENQHQLHVNTVHADFVKLAWLTVALEAFLDYVRCYK